MAGICVPLPEADPLVEPWRREHDWTHRGGLPAHVTVRMPFPSDIPLGPETLAGVVDAFLPIEVVLRRLENRAGALVILVEPDAGLRSLTHAIGDACRALPPHRGGQSFAYHITTLRTAAPALINTAAKAIERELPRVAVGRELWRFDWVETELSVTWKSTRVAR